MYSLRRLTVGDYKKLSHVKSRRSVYTISTRLFEPADKDTQIKENLEPLVKKPPRPPFVKNMFLGRYDNDLLAYPEFLGEKRLKLLDLNTRILQNMYKENVNPSEIDRVCTIPEHVLQILRSLKLFGVGISSNYGGLEFTHTEKARIYESLSLDTSIAAMLFSHETLGTKVIAKYGSEEIKDRYLKDLTSGRKVAAYCANEPESGADLSESKTYSVEAGEEHLITGEKTWVMNADKADVFVVFAKPKVDHLHLQQKTNKYYQEEDAEAMVLPDDLAVYLVDKHAKGIVVHERKDTLGVRGLHMCDVTFQDTPVSEKNILGSINQGYDIAKEFLVEDRYLIGVMALTILRNVLDDVTKFSINKQLYGDSLCNYGLTQMKLTDICLHAYAIESMIYFTTGLLDMYEDSDCEIENAIVKIYSSRVAWQSICDAMQLLGGTGYIRNNPYERYFRDLKVLSIFDVSNEVLQVFIALSGLKYISNDINEEVVSFRNQLHHPQGVLRRAFNRRKVEDDDPDLILALHEYLHPSCCHAADLLEYCVLRFEYAISVVMSREGVFIVNNQYALKRIADAAILLYAMTACISRASRAYCIGSKYAEQEMVLAETVIRRYHQNFKATVEGLVHSEFYVPDDNSKQIADRIIKTSGFFPYDPLALTY